MASLAYLKPFTATPQFDNRCRVLRIEIRAASASICSNHASGPRSSSTSVLIHFPGINTIIDYPPAIFTAAGRVIDAAITSAARHFRSRPHAMGRQCHGCGRLGYTIEARRWREQSDLLVRTLIRVLWDPDRKRFVSKRVRDGYIGPGDCVLPFIPLLGKTPARGN